jgi:hypothetical protein
MFKVVGFLVVTGFLLYGLVQFISDHVVVATDEHA